MTAEPLVLDTNVVSRLLDPALAAATRERLGDAAPTVTFVTVGELARAAEHARWEPRRRAELIAVLARLPVIPGDVDVARRWGAITGALLRAGRPLSVNDSWIAACCLRHGVPLMTHNPRDFTHVPGLRLIAA